MTIVGREVYRGLLVIAAVYSALWLVQSLEVLELAKLEPVSVSNHVDRSNKADRLTPVAPVARPTVLVGCEDPFSSLTTVSSSKFSMRCLT
jgi:hypothetical protein